MYEQILEDAIFVMLYAVVTVLAALGCVYLLFRRGNAFAADVTPPLRLRRWAAAFLAVIALGHVWYWPAMAFSSSEAVERWMLIGGLLDCLLTIPVALVVMLCMLQDKRRPLWPVWLAMVPLVIMMGVNIANCSDALMPWMQGYFLLASIGFMIYMVFEVRQYGRWLRDNYADLEHKEVWQSLLVLAVIMFLFVYYVTGYGSITYEYIIQVSGLLLIGHLLWRVETLQDLSFQPMADGDIALAEAQRATAEAAEADDDALDGDGGRPQPAEGLSEAVILEIGKLLHDRCEGNKLYLQTDLTSVQLAQALGTNRTYLGMYFSSQGTTYNAYINTLRINYFIELFRQASAAAEGQSIQAKQLAARSGYRSYRTFSVAFKQRTGQSVKDWIAEQESSLQSNKQ